MARDYGNPFMAPNPIAAGLDGLTKGLMGGYQFITEAERAKADQNMKQQLFDAQMAQKNMEMEQAKKAALLQENYRQDVAKMYAPPQTQNEAAFNTSLNDNALDYKVMPDGRRVAMMTDEGNQQMTGLMAGGFSPQNLSQLMMKYGSINNIPDMLKMQYQIEDRPISQAQAQANLEATLSGIDTQKQSSLSQTTDKVDLGDRVIYLDKRTGQPITDPRTGRPMAPYKKGAAPASRESGSGDLTKKVMDGVEYTLKNLDPDIHYNDYTKMWAYNDPNKANEAVPQELVISKRKQILAGQMSGKIAVPKAGQSGAKQAPPPPLTDGFVVGTRYKMSDGSIKEYKGIKNGKKSFE